MSFSSEVKEELYKHIGSARHCQLAELSAILIYNGYWECDCNEQKLIYIQTDNVLTVRKCFTIIKKAFNIITDILPGIEEKHINGHIYRPFMNKADEVEMVLRALHFQEEDGSIIYLPERVSPLIVKSACCRRAFLRDAFLCIGSMSDPEKSYHLEFVCTTRGQADDIRGLLESFDIEGRIVVRKKYFVVYLKEGEEIVDLLNVMEAHVSLMKMENFRIYKGMRNSVNRQVNCEAANINRTVTAATRQTEDIIYIQKHYGFANLQEGLRQMAEVRLKHPDSTLQELGGYLDPPVGKSGVNHRLRKLSELAEKLRS